MQLYKLAESFAALMARREEAQETAEQSGVVPSSEQYGTEVDALFTSLEDKLENCGKYRTMQDSEAEAYEKEAARLTAKAQACRKRSDGMKRYIFDCLCLAGVQKVTAGVFKFRLQKNSAPSISYGGKLSDLPKEYVRVVPATLELNKDLALMAYKGGASLPEGVKVEFGQHLRVS